MNSVLRLAELLCSREILRSPEASTDTPRVRAPGPDAERRHTRQRGRRRNLDNDAQSRYGVGGHHASVRGRTTEDATTIDVQAETEVDELPADGELLASDRKGGSITDGTSNT